MVLENVSIAAIALVAALLLVGVLALARRRGRSNQRLPSARLRAPRDLQFVCAGCSQRFPHTKRTVGAFERGTTRLFCNACHGKWVSDRPREQRPVAVEERSLREVRGCTYAAESHSQSGASHSSPSPSRVRAPSGCLGTALVLISVPLVLVIYAAVT